LKWFLNWASIKGHNRNLSYKQFRFRKKEKIIIARPDIYLTPPELIRILKLKIQDQRVELVRDAFCFACFTGLNYAELARLRKKDISGTQLCYNPHKTNRIVVVELADTSKIIAEKYKSTPGIFLFVLPGIQVFNRVLKEIGNQAGIDEMHCLDVLKEDTRYPKWQLLSSSASKRTFINMCVGLGIGMDVMTGLTGYAASTLNKYYPLAKDKINNEIRKLNSAIITNI
jgi:integrase